MENSPKKRSFNKNRKKNESSIEIKDKNSYNERAKRKDSRLFKSKYQEVEEKIKKRKFGTEEKKYRDNDHKPRRSFNSQEERPRKRFSDNGEKPRRSFNNQEERPQRRFNDSGEKPRRSFNSQEERPRRRFNDNGEKPRRSFNNQEERPRRRFNDNGEKPRRSFNNQEEKPRRRFNDSGEKPRRNFNNQEERPRRKRYDDNEQQPLKKRRRDVTAESSILSEIVEKRRREGRSSPQKQKILSLEYEEQYGPIRLNKYISNSGVCSRRDADILISSGAITVNGQVVTELGAKVMPTDEVRFEDKVLQREKPVYILLNKPKDYITTAYDERDRHDVMELIRGACKERVYPVGRLDKNTTGVLLFTNDGEMAKKLTHPKHNIRKTYHIELNQKLSDTDSEAILNGIELQDGPIKADDLAYVDESKKEIGITIHSGRNRIVRRIFESLGYEIVKLDRVVFAGLDKKNVLRGKWRFLTQNEVNFLKML